MKFYRCPKCGSVYALTDREAEARSIKEGGLYCIQRSHRSFVSPELERIEETG